jgi:histidinol phosphatase-like enzyme (inositol monophosphatase family)
MAVTVPAGVVSLAESLADTAAAIVRERFRKPFAFEAKSDATPVTEVDRLVETACREIIARERPDDGVIGEEFGAKRPDADWQWIIDPIDGTRAFMAGRPTFGTLIAAAYCGVPVVGVIDQPITRDRWTGVRGETTHFNGERATTRACASLAQAVLGTTSPEMFAGANAHSWESLRAAAASRVYGGDCTSYGALASGWLDVVVEAGLKAYDFAALVPVIEGAGGVITDWHGKPLDLLSDGRVVALGDRSLHEAALRALRAA